MKAIEYLNSRDLAAYLKEIGFEFNAMQAAYVIYINGWLTIKERIELWQEIVDTMPDCEFQYALNYSIEIKPSAHAAIREHIEKIKSDLENFMATEDKEGKAIYIPISSRWEKRPKWLRVTKEYEHTERGVWNRCKRAVPFTSFEKCIQYLKNESALYERSESWGAFEPFDRHRIGRTTLDSEYADCYQSYPAPEPVNFFLERITLNGNFEPLDVKMDWYGNVFENVVPEIPHPFECGDILIDAAKDGSLPFVFDRCVTWTLEDEEAARRKRDRFYNMLEKEGVEITNRTLPRSMSLEETNTALAERCSTAGSCYFAHGHMFAYGYEVDAFSEDALMKYNWGGACDNYLNLEYYNGPFEDKLSILPTVSWFVMNEDRTSHDSVHSAAIAKDKTRKKFESRAMDAPDVSLYDICSLVNEGYRIG